MAGALKDQVAACPSSLQGEDLTWLVHRFGQRLRAGLDALAREAGLQGAREWIVLTALGERPGRTQLALAQELGLDKTTMTSLLDRLELDGFLVRRQLPNDRRARIPEITTAGRRVQAKVATCRQAAEAAAMLGLSAREQQAMRSMLVRLAESSDVPSPGGSCM
jgi:DNA-binding MarR family transcriptional regulator